jgi:hypothetical protein
MEITIHKHLIEQCVMMACASKADRDTVRELRKVTAWPENLAVTTPQERHADSAVRVSKVSIATRTTPKT